MATFDVKISGGTIIDGSGEPSFQGDVGIKDGVITSIGEAFGEATRTIDAAGAIVTPGFTDMHTHYDGQISWDADLAPSCFHGVTTIVMGNCGVGFAPVKPHLRQRLIDLMEGVEDIPGTALAEGLTWDWETFPEYMSALDSRPHTLNFAAMVPHDALRIFVMGERAAAYAPATEGDIKEMQAVLREALEAGAAGFATGRTDNHRTTEGKATPASEVELVEMIALGEAFKGLDYGVLQAVSDFNMSEGPEAFDAEYDLLEAMAIASGGRPMSLSWMQRDQAPGQWEQIMRRAEAAVKKGLPTRLQAAPRAIGVMLGLTATFHPFMGFPSFKKISHLPLDEQVQAMKNPEFKARLLKEKSEPVAGDGSALPPLADVLLSQIAFVAMRLYRLGEEPNYEPDPMTCLAVEATTSGRSVLETIYDALLEEEGKALIYFPLYNYGTNNLDIIETMLHHPLAIPGLSDGGAHVGTVCDASFPTFLMSHWGRDREKGRLPIEKIIKMQAFDTSRHMGFNDRGAIALGQRADLNIIDFDRLSLDPPRMRADLPKGGLRLVQGATGFIATLVGGETITEGGILTGARPGRLVRAGQ